MADFETIQERNISGKGVLRVPSDYTKSRLLILYCSVFRKPKAEYLNYNYSPPRSRYAFLTFWRNGYVIGQSSVEYPSQSFDGLSDVTSQTLIAVKCAYAGILQSFINLTNALAFTPGGLGLTYLSVTDLIKDYEYLNLSWDEVRVVCYADTAINLKLVALEHDSCDDQSNRPRKPPPPPPPPPSVPPGTPVEGLDPPYEEDDFTEPYDGDSNEEEPIGEQCVLYDVTIVCQPLQPELYPPETYTRRMYGEIVGARPNNEGRNAAIICRGGPDSFDPPPSPCLEDITECVVISNTNPAYASVTITSVVPVE